MRDMQQTTDRELMEAAARACHLYDEWPAPNFEIQWNGEGLWCSGNGRGMLWNPLADDGDALRLAVKLNLALLFPMHGAAHQQVGAGQVGSPSPAKLEPAHPDKYAATRRAIVRAAAACK